MTTPHDTTPPASQEQSEIAEHLEALAAVQNDEFPWSVIADWLVFAPISDLAYRVFGVLRAFANKEKGGHTSFPSQATIARALGYAKRDAIGSAIAELENIGAVTRTIKSQASGRFTLYRTNLIPPDPKNYPWPRRSSDLRDPGMLEDLAAARRPRRKPRVTPVSGVTDQTGVSGVPIQGCNTRESDVSSKKGNGREARQPGPRRVTDVSDGKRR